MSQNIFRQIVITNYFGKCTITGIDTPDLFLASHIIPWSKNEEERLNPENGICLSPLYDRAYDQDYISINEKYEILLSSEIKKKSKEKYHRKYFAPLSVMKIILPAKYNPKKEFLQYHLEEVFKK